jgi:hypothetical protein
MLLQARLMPPPQPLAVKRNLIILRGFRLAVRKDNVSAPILLLLVLLLLVVSRLVVVVRR